jgi:hypothetical protein
VLDTVSEREAGVVSRFGLTDGQPKTLEQISKVYEVTKERIRQIESKTMSKLRHPSRSNVLRDYSADLTDGRQPQDVTSDPRPPGSWAHRMPRTGRPAA